MLGQEEAIDQLIRAHIFSSTEVLPQFTIDGDERFRQKNGDYTLKGKIVNIILTPSQGLTRQELWAQTIQIADTAKYLGAKSVNLLSTELSYSRQDRGHFEGRKEQLEAIARGEKDAKNKMQGQGISARTQAKSFKAFGIDRILTMHLHSERILKYFGQEYGCNPRDVVFDLNPMPVVAHYILTHLNLEGLVYIVPPDAGAMKDGNVMIRKMKKYGLALKVGSAYGNKFRTRPNDPTSVTIEVIPREEFFRENIKDATIVCPDDIIDTAGTIRELTNTLGKAKRTIVYATHAILSGQGPYILADSPNIDLVIVGGTYNLDRRFLPRLKDKMVGLNFAPFFYQGFLKCIVGGQRVKDAFNFKNPAMFNRAGDLYEVVPMTGYVNHRDQMTKKK